MKAIALALLALLIELPAWASDGSLYLEFDASIHTTCEITIPCNCRGRMYVFGQLSGASASGITAAEYKINVGTSSAADPGWLFSEAFPTGTIVLGSGALNPPDPMQRGVDLAWPACQTGDAWGRVLLETVDIFNLGCTYSELKLQVVKHDRPSNSFFQCPLYVLCDAPVYTMVCTGSVTQCQNPEPPYANNASCSTGGTAYINPSPNRSPCCLSCPPGVADCTVAIEPRTWSGMKRLYRN